MATLRSAFPATTLLIVAAAGLALALRLPRLNERPLHTDEAVQGIKTSELLGHGLYRYDPREYHGPTLYYLALPLAWARGEHTVEALSATTIRLLPVLFGTGLILLGRLLRKTMSPVEAGAAALLAAVSPAFVYFSRYYIQEMLLVGSGFGLLIAAWRYHESRRPLWAAWVGLFAGLMHASKETCVIMFIALAAAWWLTRPRADWLRLPRIPATHVAIAAACAAAISMLFYSSFFTHPRGPWDSLVSLIPFAKKTAGTGHDKPWTYYLAILFNWKAGGLRWHELAIMVPALAGLVAMVAEWRSAEPAARLRRVVALYALILFAIYAVIPYKTPWLLLGPLHGFVLLAAFGIGWMWRLGARFRPAQAVLVLLVAAAAWQSGRMAWRGAARFGADERNPYAYSHTSRDCVRLAERVVAMRAFIPPDEPFVVKIMSPEYWPLPWYFRSLPHVGYWPGPAEDPVAPVVLCSPEIVEGVQPLLGRPYHWEPFGIRPGRILFAGIREDLWDAYIATRHSPRTGRPGAPP